MVTVRVKDGMSLRNDMWHGLQNDIIMRNVKVSATLKIAIFPYLKFQRFQIDMLESFLLKQKSDENIISVERYRG